MPYLLRQSLTDFLVLEGGKFLPFEWRGPGAHCVAMEISQYIYHAAFS